MPAPGQPFTKCRAQHPLTPTVAPQFGAGLPPLPTPPSASPRVHARRHHAFSPVWQSIRRRVSEMKQAVWAGRKKGEHLVGGLKHGQVILGHQGVNVLPLKGMREAVSSCPMKTHESGVQEVSQQKRLRQSATVEHTQRRSPEEEIAVHELHVDLKGLHAGNAAHVQQQHDNIQSRALSVLRQRQLVAHSSVEFFGLPGIVRCWRCRLHCTARGGTWAIAKRWP